MKYEFEPIGEVVCEQKYRYEAPRQAVYADNHGYIQLNPKCNFEQALEDLAGFERIWVTFVFHLNNGWKPKVSPPVIENRKKIGLFATRSPHRPNSIGMSAVVLEKIDGLKLFIRNFDMLDKTPVLDIKPYIPVSDAFPNSKAGWLDEINSDSEYEVKITDTAEKEIEWIKSKTSLDLLNFCKIQLSESLFDKKRQRLTEIDSNLSSISCRTWSVIFSKPKLSQILIEQVVSNYSQEELDDLQNDPHNDKAIHLAFNSNFTP